MQNFGIKLKKFIEDNSKSIILASAITLCSFGILVFKIQSSYSAFSKNAFLVYFLFAVITALMVLILYKAKKNSWKIEKTFLVCGLILGAFYVFFLPISGVPDEHAHFWRAYELSEGRLFTETDNNGNTGMYIPDNLRAATSDKYSTESNGYQAILNDIDVYASEKYVLDSTPAETYSPLNYIPQVVGVWVGKILHLPLIPTMYLSRLFNMILCIIIIYFCIKYIPIMKKITFLAALFPMSMQLFSSVSADGSIICAGFAIITFVLYSREKMKRLLNYKDVLLLIFICSVLVISKPVYAFLCPLLFWIPQKRFKSNRQKITIIFFIGAILLSLVLLRLLFAPIGEARFDSAAQINLITSNPFIYLGIIFKNFFLSPNQFITGAIGEHLEWLSVDLYSPYIITFFLFFGFLCAEHETKITRSLRIFVLCSFFTIVIFTFTTMFIQWTEPGSTIIEGVQGRYFLPIILLIPLFCLPSKKFEKRQIVKSSYLTIFAILANVYALMIIFCTHI